MPSRSFTTATSSAATRLLWTTSLVGLLSAAGCNLFTEMPPCDVDANCPPSAPVCSDHVCTAEEPAPDDGGDVVVDAGDDAGRPDAGPLDAGPDDAGLVDAGPLDAGPDDAGPVDGGPLDAGSVDAGPPDGGLDGGDVDGGGVDAGADAGVDAGGLVFPYDIANVDETTLSAQLPLDFTACTSAVLNTDDLASSMFVGCAPSLDDTWRIVNANAMDHQVVATTGLTLPAGLTVEVVGSASLVLVVDGDANVAGALDASGSATAAGAGGDVACGPRLGGAGGLSSDRGSGGGGGGHLTAGGAGGTADNGGAPGGAEGALVGGVPFVLRGGCSGGAGGGDGSSGGAGGFAGGALQISVSGTLTLDGELRAGGGGGQPATAGGHGGGGGGSGGSILVQASHVVGSGVLQANGGGGAGGSGRFDGENGAPGESPLGVDRGRGGAGGGTGGNAGGGGGDGASDGRDARQGESATYGGGGGGGGLGAIHIEGVTTCAETLQSSPAATTSCP